MGTCGHDEHHGFQFGDFTKSSPDVEYVGLIIELGAKWQDSECNALPLACANSFIDLPETSFHV